MNKKAGVFKKYLDDNQITCFIVDELEDETLKTSVFRSFIEVEGQQLPTIVILDNSIYGIIRVQIAGNVVRADNETLLMKQINELNRQYKVFKYYLNEDGSLYLDSCVLSKSGQVEGELIYTVLDVIIKHLTDEYKNIMKLVWG